MTRVGLLVVGGCAVGPPTDPGYLRLRGAVDPGVVVVGGDAELVVAWATAVGGQTCVEVDHLPFAPELFAYQAEVDGPPSLDGDPCVPSPADLRPRGPFAVGALVLLDPDPGQVVTVSADPSTLLGWLAGDQRPVSDVFVASGGVVAAVGAEHALFTTAEEPPEGDAWCRFAGAVPGLVLYEDHGPGCAGWAPVAAAGERTEIQGVDLAPAE